MCIYFDLPIHLPPPTYLASSLLSFLLQSSPPRLRFGSCGNILSKQPTSYCTPQPYPTDVPFLIHSSSSFLPSFQTPRLENVLNKLKKAYAKTPHLDSRLSSKNSANAAKRCSLKQQQLLRRGYRRCRRGGGE